MESVQTIGDSRQERLLSGQRGLPETSAHS